MPCRLFHPLEETMEFRRMRKSVRQMEQHQAEEVLRSQDYGVLCVHGDEGYPYGVPVNYGYVDGKIYIHCTSERSHKADAIQQNNKVCFTVISRHNMIEAVYSTQYTSVIVFGSARLLTEETEKRQAIHNMMAALAPSMEQEAIDSCSLMKDVIVIEITPDHITGKTNR